MFVLSATILPMVKLLPRSIEPFVSNNYALSDHPGHGALCIWAYSVRESDE